jgi:hypothetical protein
MSKARPSREAVAEYLAYDPATGIFRWKKRSGNSKAGTIAGTLGKRSPGDRTGRRRINILGGRYPAANIAWLLMTGAWPEDRIDHRNNDGTDDRWINLREATQAQNMMNQSVRSDSPTGFKGIRFYKRNLRKPWAAHISGKHIGYFATAEDAAIAYDAAAIETYGEFAYLNFPAEEPTR